MTTLGLPNVTPDPDQVAELEQLENDVLWTEKGHFASAGGLRAIRLLIGIGATLASTASAATIVADNDTVAGVLALVGALLAALLTFLKPEELAQQHLVAGRRLGALRVQIRQTTKLDTKTQPSSAIRVAIDELSTKKAQLHDDAPHVTDLSIWWTGKRIAKKAYENERRPFRSATSASE